jgi:hypothetical protein
MTAGLCLFSDKILSNFLDVNPCRKEVSILVFINGSKLMRKLLIRNRIVLPVVVLAVCLALGSQSALANTLYNVDCGTTNSPTYSGAAVLGSAGDVWNAYTNGSWVPTPGPSITLLDSTGTLSSVQFNVGNNSGASNWTTGNEPVNPGDLMADYLEAPGWGAADGWPIKARFSNLPASTPFTLVVYSSGSSTGQAGEITLVDPSGNIVKDTTAASRDISAGEGVAYQTFAGTTDANGGVYFEVKTITDDWHALNGVQLDIVPEPSVIVLLLMGGLMMLLRLKKR